MAAIDKKIIEACGLTMAEIANCLGISRQAVAKHIAHGTKEFFDANRCDQLLTALSSLNTPKHANSALALTAALKNIAGVDIAPPLPRPPKTIYPANRIDSREIWIFSNEPLELDEARNGFLEFMQEHVFADASKLLVYFVSSEDVAEQLAHAIENAAALMGERSVLFQANIFIIETNMVVGMPHTLVLDAGSKFVATPSGDLASAWVFVGADRDQFAELPSGSVRSIVKAVQKAKIGNTSYNLNEFFPKIESNMGYVETRDYIRFKLHKKYPLDSIK
jgi:hypothetical protein